MNNITIKNLRNATPTQPWQVRVDRTSALGNPFKMQKDSEAERNRVCDAYQNYFNAAILETKRIKEEIHRLLSLYREHGKLELFCWCAPKRCHAETIVRYIANNATPKPIQGKATDHFMSEQDCADYILFNGLRERAIPKPCYSEEYDEEAGCYPLLYWAPYYI